jgi:3-hydroxybutyryl-CoA dehydratase
MNHSSIKMDDLKIGLHLPEIKKGITQKDINRYAKVSGDCNPIHVDDEFARKTPLGGTIAHGMLIAAYISQMLTAAFGEAWLSSGKLGIRFRTPAKPGDTVTATGTVTKIDKGATGITVHIDVYCHNQKNEEVITGEARVAVEP